MNHVFALIILLTYSCSSNIAKNEKINRNGIESLNDSIPLQIVAGNFIDSNSHVFDSSKINEFYVRNPELIQVRNNVEKFYANRNYSFAWFINKELSEQANVLFNRILYINDHGINYKAPYLDKYKKIMIEYEKDSVIENELMISSQYFYFAKTILSGINENDIKGTAWFIPLKKIDYANLLNEIIQNKKDGINHILYPQYDKLLEYLKKYLLIEKNYSWKKIIGTKKKIIVGDTADIVKNIRSNLFLIGDIAENNESSIMDLTVEESIKKFQERNGLKIDGIIGKNFIEEMNVPLSERIETLLVNLERCKWLPNETSREHIIINIPEFSLTAFNKEDIIFKCKVVVGKTTNKTMIFKGDMKYIVFSPYWNIPESIIKKEILPKMQKNPNYLDQNNMEWNDGKIRQKPGEWNALGRVKFVFPNMYNIYLHDTPSKYLFEEQKRTFSHGCVRISEPVKMIEYLLQNDSSWNIERINEAMYSGYEKHVQLKKSIPVYIVYFTAFVDEKGLLNFRKDIYNRDILLKKILFKN
jgi:murein L,D-transpeptidase YcbB/YkuD